MSKDLARVQRQVQPRLRLRKWFAAASLLAVISPAFWLYWSYRYRVTLSATDTIVLADAKNETSDPVFDDALNTALRSGMDQTPYLNILGIDKVLGTLAQLKLPATIKLTPEVARQVRFRTNSKLVQRCDSQRVGDFIPAIDVFLLLGQGCSRAAAERPHLQMIAQSSPMPAIAIRFRAKLGEPADSLARFNQPVEKALSASLEAP